MDLWYIFACIGIDILNTTGHLCFIATNNWVTCAGAKKLRNKIILDSQIKQLVDFGNLKIFEKASIQTMIMLFSKNCKIDNYMVDFRRLSGNTSLSDAIDLLNKNMNRNALYLSPYVIRNIYIDKYLTFSFNDSILEKLIKNCIFFNEKEIAQGIVHPQDFLNLRNKEILGNNFIVGEGIFVLNESEIKNLNLMKKELNLLKTYYTTEQIYRYYTIPENKYWTIYTNSNYKNPKSMSNYPNLKKHLDKYKRVITSDNKPYGLHRSREEQFFKGEKIIVQRKCVERPSFSYSDFDCYVSATFYIIKTSRLSHKYLLGILNSKLITFWLKNKGKMQGNNFQLDKEPLLQIPIFNANTVQQKEIIEFVNTILEMKERNLQADTIGIEKKIDKKIYELYGLSKSEIEIIDSIS